MNRILVPADQVFAPMEYSTNSNRPQLKKEFTIWGKCILAAKKRFSLTPVDPRTPLHSNIYSILDAAGANVVFRNDH